MALYVKFIETRKERPRDVITPGQGFVGVSRGRSDFKVDVEFYADEDGVRELTQVCAKDEPVRVISGNSTYVAQYQQQAYEERIRTLEAANSGLLSQVRELERQVRRIARDDARLGIEPIGVLMDGPAKSGDLISIDLSKNFLTSGRVSVQASAPVGAPEIQYPAEGVVLNSVNQYGLLSVSVGQWTVGAFFTGAGDPKVGDLVELTLSGSGNPPTMPDGTIVARKRLPKVEDRDSWMSDAARMANEMGVSQEEAIARVNRMALDGILAQDTDDPDAEETAEPDTDF